MLVLSLLLCVCFTTANETDANSATLNLAGGETFDGEPGETFDRGLQGLEIAPKVITNVVYGNSRLSVWGHLDNPNRTPDKQLFFVMPVVMLVPESAVCREKIFSEASMQFEVIMWSENVASAVLTHLRLAIGNPKLSSLQVTTLPMEQFRLTWTNSAQDLSGKFRLNTEWRSYANQDNILTFQIVVKPAEECPKAAEHLKARPDSLISLELQYVLHGTRASRKQIIVRGQHILEANMYAKLQNKVDPATGSVYLKSEDLNKLASDVVSNVVASTTTDVDYIDSGDTVSLTKLVYDNLATFKQSMAEMTPKMWESTFWQNENARPDKLTTFLSKMMTKDEGHNRSIIVDDKMASSATSASVGFSTWFASGSVSSSHSTVDKSHVSEDDLRTWLRENHKEVQWTGEKFEVKSMDLYRLNTQQINQQQDIVVTYVQLHQTQYTYKVPVSFPRGTTGVEGNRPQPNFAITKRLDGLDALMSKETAERMAAISNEVADRTAADTKEMVERKAAEAEEMAERIAADAEGIEAAKAYSTNAVAQLKATMEAKLDIVAKLLTGVETYQHQWFKVLDNPSRRWDRAAAVCASHGGIPATALSKHLMRKIQHIIPHGSAWHPQVVVGLQSSGKPTTGWRWIDGGTGKLIDVDRGNTVKPMWLSGQPDREDERELNGAIYNDRNIGYGFNNVRMASSQIPLVLCQFVYSKYEFQPVHKGRRLTKPHESSVAAATLAACTESCRKSGFCRTFSYSVSKKDCRHHSTATDDPEAVTVGDSNYIIYA